jgi:hypothetical protein
MSRIFLPPRSRGAPLTTVIGWMIQKNVFPDRWDARLACGHLAFNLRTQPKVGDRHPCKTCCALRTPRAYRVIMNLARMDLTEREVEYLAGRLAEQRDRKDGSK